MGQMVQPSPEEDLLLNLTAAKAEARQTITNESSAKKES
jgi:hypothetical protein